MPGPSLSSFLQAQLPAAAAPTAHDLLAGGILNLKPTAHSLGPLHAADFDDLLPSAAVDHFPLDTFREALHDLQLPDLPIFDLFDL